MRSTSIQPFSLVIGLAFGLVCFLTMGQTTVRASALGSTVRVEYMPHPRDYIQIREGSPFTVPSGSVLVVTGLGSTSPTTSNTVNLTIDGQQELQTNTGTNAIDTPTVRPVTGGLTATSGSVVAVSGSSSNNGRAWGFLAPL